MLFVYRSHVYTLFFFFLYLVESREYVVGELDLGDSGDTDVGQADPEARDALLAQRGVEHAIRAEAIAEAHRAAEHAAELHVLAEEHCRGRLDLSMKWSLGSFIVSFFSP